MRRVNGHSTKTFCQNIKAAATVRKVDQWIWPSRKKQSTAGHVQVLQLVVEGEVEREVEREVEMVVLFVLGYRKRISVWFSSQLNRAWQQQQQNEKNSCYCLFGPCQGLCQVCVSCICSALIALFVPHNWKVFVAHNLALVLAKTGLCG